MQDDMQDDLLGLMGVSWDELPAISGSFSSIAIVFTGERKCRYGGAALSADAGPPLAVLPPIKRRLRLGLATAVKISWGRVGECRSDSCPSKPTRPV